MNTQSVETSNKSEKGFTLVELLIVIVILGILATIVVFSVRGLTGKANENSCKIDARSMQTGFEAFYADKGIYPISEADFLAGDFIEKVTTKWTVTYDGTGVAAPVLSVKTGSACKVTDLP